MGVAEAVELGLVNFRPVEPDLTQVGGEGFGALSQEGEVMLGVAVALKGGEEPVIGDLEAVAEQKAGAAVIPLAEEGALPGGDPGDLLRDRRGLWRGGKGRGAGPDIAPGLIEQAALGQHIMVKGSVPPQLAIDPAGMVDPEIDRPRMGGELCAHPGPVFRAGHFLLIDLDQQVGAVKAGGVFKAENPQDLARIMAVKGGGRPAGGSGDGGMGDRGQWSAVFS